MRLPVAFAIIATALILLWPAPPRVNTDGRYYLNAAAAFARGQDDPAYRQWPPLLPLILATGFSPRLLNALTYGALVYLTLANVSRYRVALGLAMLTPLMFYSYLFVLSDGLFTALTIAILLELPRRRILPLALLLMACVLTKYSGLYMLIFVGAWRLRHVSWQNAAFAVFPALTAFAGWCLRNLALTGSLMGTRAAARFPAGESIVGTLATLAQFGGVICGLVCLEILFSRLLSGTRRSSS